MKVVEAVAARVNTRKILKQTGVFLAVFSIIGFLVFPPIIKSVLLKKLSETLHRDVIIQTVRFNPFMLSLTVRGLEVKEPKSQQRFVSFEELYLNFQTMSLIRRGIIIKEVLLKKPYINVVRNEDLTFNFTDLLQMAEKKPEDKKQEDATASSLRFSLNNIQVLGAAIDFMDSPKHSRHTVKDAALSVPFISNLPYYLDSYVQPMFSATVNGHTVAFKGNAKPFVDSLETSIDLNIKDLDLPYYLVYSPVPLKFKLVSGSFDALASISYVQYKDKKPTLSLNGRTSLKQLRITDKADALLVHFPRIEISISSSDLMSLYVHFAKIDVQSPEINVVIDKNGQLNLLALMPEQSGKPAGGEKDSGKGDVAGPPPEKEPLPIIEADEMLLAGGKITFADLSEKRNFRTRLDNIQAKARRFSTGKDKKGEAEISFQTDTKEAVKLTSTFSVEPRAAEGSVEASRIALKKYLPYYQEFLNFTVEAGEIEIQTKYLFQQTEKEADIRISGCAATLSSLRLRKTEEKKNFLSIPSASVKDLSADLTKREVVIGDISTEKGTVLAKRYRIGTLLFSTLVRVSERLEPVAKPEPQSKKQTPPGKPWALTVNSLLLDRYTITYEDEMPVDPVVVTLEKVRVKGENLSNVSKAKGKLAVNLRMGDKGFVDANGSVTIEPPSANLKLTLRNIPLLALQSYFADLEKVIVTDGSISSKGTVLFAHAKDTGPGVKYKGEVSLNNFASVDKVKAEDFLKWGSLHVETMDISFAPLVATIGEVSLADFYARVIINADGSINLQNIMEKKEVKAEGQEAPELKKEPAETAPPPETPKKMVKIEKVTLQGGMVNFSDNYIRPNFTTNMLEIGGRVTGLSSEETKMADVELRGKLENYAPLEITGRINPLRDDLFIDLKVSFKDMDLSPLTPYSGKYLGYGIDKGKLTLNLQYLIEKKKLDAQNKLLLDQFTLGSQVDSPDATKLPVRLAIALLKNRQGEINLDVPVSGQMDDPQFSLGRIILKILVNLLVKAATSPFALLGALFGGGEELSYVEFDPGMHDLNAEGIKKLNTLLKALNDRPSLKLEIEGHVDLEKDTEGLKQYLFDRKVKAQKLKDLAKKGGETVSMDEIKVEPAEYPKYLKVAYQEEKFPKPRNIIGMAKDLPVPEMEKLMITNIVVKDDDLKQLSSQRALVVKDHILKSKQVEPERVFLIAPKAIRPEKKENVADSRVDFRLK